MHILFLSLLLSSLALANMEIYPKKECALYNNMKHTKNRGHVVIQMDRAYEMLNHHKGQYLVKVLEATPVQRWVDDDCLSLRPRRGTPIYEVLHNPKEKSHTVQKVKIEDKLNKKEKSVVIEKPVKKKHTKKYEKTNISKQNLLTLSWHNAFCETHRYKKECKRGLLSGLRKKYSESHFVLHGLWPQPRSKMYCGVSKKHVGMDKHKQWNRLPSLGLSSATKEALKNVMPGFSSNLHKHEWFKHGTCYGTDAEHYYKDAVRLVDAVNNSKVGSFFTRNIGKSVTLKQVRHLFDTNFGVGAGKRVEMKCKGGLLTELWLHIGSGSDKLSELLQKGQITRSRCQKGRIDKAGFGR